MKCRTDHRVLASDDSRLHREATYIGLQCDGDGWLLELWNHEAPCGSTFSRVARPSPLLTSRLREMAATYAARLLPGRVLSDNDPFFLPFGFYLPAALAKRGMEVERVDGGWLVCSLDPDGAPTLEICRGCTRQIADCTCNQTTF